MANRSHAEIRQTWVDRIDRCEKNQQTVAQFCGAEGVSTASFYQWRRKLRTEKSVDRSLAQFVPVKIPTSTHPRTATVMSVDLPGGVRIRFDVTTGKQGQP